MRFFIPGRNGCSSSGCVWVLAFLAAVGAVRADEMADAIRLEAELAQRLGGVTVGTEGAGFSGTGYATGFKSEGDRIVWAFSSKAGIYDLTVRYRSAEKGVQLVLNGDVLSVQLRDSSGAFAEQRLGKVALRDGENTLSIHGGWFYYEIDQVELAPAAIPECLAKPPAVPCDPQAIPAVHALLGYLVDHYGERTLSGALDGPDVDYLREVTGQLPAIVAADMADLTTASIRNQGIVAGQTERMIARAREGHILTYFWHWRSPTGLVDKMIDGPDGKQTDARWYKGFYTFASTFDVEKALADPASADYLFLLADIDMVAAEMRKFADRDIPILWRPLHESEGRWFWWGVKGPQTFIKLWRLVYERFTQRYGLHNLLWVYTGTGNPEWYPGDDVVDIVGIDAYPADVRDPLSATWDDAYATFAGKKLLALAEFGGVPDLESARRFGVKWSYFASWTDDLGPKKMERETLKRLYANPRLLHHAELPKDRWVPKPESAVR